jgi:hypothetical protein
MHSHRQHKQVSAGHRRARQFLNEQQHHAAPPAKKKHGGATSRGEFRQMEDDAGLHAEGRKGRHRSAYAKGGKVKHQTNIVIVGHHGPDAGMMAAAPPGMMGPPPAPPMAGPGLPPAAGMPGQPLPVRARGGRAYPDVPEDISSYQHAREHKARGGRLPNGGAASGIGRLEAFEREKRHGH